MFAAMSEQKSSFIGIQWLLGAGCGALIANIYYAQPLTGLISSALGIHPQHTGLIMTLALLGYGIGLRWFRSAILSRIGASY
jgi:hypothetical protein